MFKQVLSNSSKRLADLVKDLKEGNILDQDYKNRVGYIKEILMDSKIINDLKEWQELLDKAEGAL